MMVRCCRDRVEEGTSFHAPPPAPRLAVQNHIHIHTRTRLWSMSRLQDQTAQYYRLVPILHQTPNDLLHYLFRYYHRIHRHRHVPYLVHSFPFHFALLSCSTGSRYVIDRVQNRAIHPPLFVASYLIVPVSSHYHHLRHHCSEYCC